MDILDNHMRLALKDVSTNQQETTQFKEKVMTEIQAFNEANLLKFS